MKWLCKNRRLLELRLGPVLLESVSGWDNNGWLGVNLLDFSMAQHKLITLIRVDFWLLEIGLHISW